MSRRPLFLFALLALSVGCERAPDADLQYIKQARSIAADVCRLAPVSVQLAKQIVDAGSGEGLGAALEALAGGLAASTEDAREGKLSFAQKRSAQYRGR